MADLQQVTSRAMGMAQPMRTCRPAVCWQNSFLHCRSAAQALQQMMSLPGQAERVLDHLWHPHAALQQGAHSLPAASAAQ